MTKTTTKTPEKLTVNPKSKSASMTNAQLLKLGRLCLLQGSKKLGTDTKQSLCDLLCCGLESGPYGSVRIEEFVEPEEMTFRTDPERVYRHLDYPMNKGGALICFDKYQLEEEGAKGCYAYRLDYDALLIGLARLSLDSPRIYADWISDNADALTGDALVQCALFGEITYG